MSATLERLDFREAMTVRLPDIDAEGVEVWSTTVGARLATQGSLEAMFNNGRGRLQEGQQFTRIKVDGKLWMSDTPDEKRDHAHVFWEAQRRGGRILIHGLGIGMIVQALLLLDNVEHIDVVESDERIARLIGSVYEERYPGRITVHVGDAYTYRFPPGTRWTMAWHDIWPTITGDNWSEMNRLHRRYGRRVDWQDSWVRDQVRRLHNADKRFAW